MYGKIFESLFQGSMVGKGALWFAVWSYVIATQRPDREVGSQVHINPKLLAAILGEPEMAVREVVEELCAPDAESTTKDEDGRRLVRMGEFSYRVVNGAKYRAIRDEAMRRVQNREAQRKLREKAKAKWKLPKNGKPLPGEVAFVEAVNEGAIPLEQDRLVEESLPQAFHGWNVSGPIS